MMRPDRVLFPETGFTKKDALAYYKRAAKLLLPHLKNVPVSFKRYPGTIGGESFWEKDAPAFTPKWVETVAIPRRTGGTDIHYIVINDLRTLMWMVDVGAIEIHPFLHRAPHIDVATSVVFDLDPGTGATFADCCRVAMMLRDALLHVKLKSFAKVSGSKGLQVHVPLNSPRVTHDATETFARLVADELARAAPKLIVAKMSKQLRAKRVFIDWSQNADYKTTIAVYSLRAKRNAPYVSMPVTWDEVSRLNPLDFSPDDAVLRMRRDLFAPVLELKQKLPIQLTRATRPARPIAPARGDKRTQSGRRDFVIAKTEQAGDELWLEIDGRWHRWILRPDRERKRRLIAVPAGDFPVDTKLRRVKFEERGKYELIEGSDEQRRFDLWFSGSALNGEWILQKIVADDAHRSWSLTPVA